VPVNPQAHLPTYEPADLARRRPDIRRAEAILHQATAEIGVAIAGLYPRLPLPRARRRLGIEDSSMVVFRTLRGRRRRPPKDMPGW